MAEAYLSGYRHGAKPDLWITLIGRSIQLPIHPGYLSKIQQEMTMRRMSVMVIALTIAAGTLVAEAAEIKVLSSPTLKTSLDALSAQFERESGHKLALSFDGVPVLKRRIEEGESFDIAILLRATIGDLMKQGKIGAGTHADIARTAAGIAIRAGAAKPSISSADGLKQVLLNTASLSYSPESASGTYFLGLLGRLGIEDEMKPKLRPVTGRSPVDAVANGEAELTVITVPNIVGVPGVELGGLLPAELQNYTTFSAGVSAKAREAGAAEDLIRFLRTPAAAAAVRERGLEPASP